MINEQPHLDNEQKRILERVFSHPTSGNIKWPQVLALLEALGEVTVESKDRYRVTVSGHTEVFRPPHPHNDLPVEVVVKLRKFLAAADQQIESDGSATQS